MHRCWTPIVLASLAAILSIGSVGKAIAQGVTTQAAPSREQLLERFQAKSFRSDHGGDLRYRILIPDSVQNASAGDPGDNRRGSFPLVLFLHGAGERGDDNQKQLIHAAADFADLRREPAVVVFPQCPAGIQWVDTPWGNPKGDGTFTETPTEPLRMALELVESLKRSMPIDSDRVYVTGLSMGGYGAWHAAALHPDRFAAVLAVCGGSDPSWAGRYNGIPIWSFHGDKDTVVPIVRGREIVSALALAGHKPELRYTEYEGVGHNSWTRTFARDDVYEWLYRQRRNRKSDK